MSTVIPWFSEKMADISKKLAEIEDAMHVKVKEGIAIQTSFKNLYILEKAKTSSKTLDSLIYREQVASMREGISKLNERVVTEIAGALMKRVVLRSEIRDEYEEKIVIERAAFTNAHRRLMEGIRDLTSTRDKMRVELEFLTAELSSSSVAFDEKVGAEVASANGVLEASHASNLLDQCAHFDTKHAKELANVADAYEVKLTGELEVVEDAFTRKVCIVESIFQRKLAEEKDVSDKYYLKYKQYKVMWQTLNAKMELLPPPQGGVACVITDHEGAPPSGIEVINAVKDLAQDEVER